MLALIIRWKEYWRYEVKINARNLSMSQIGDFISMSGDGFLTVWNRDTPNDYSYSPFVYYSREDPKGIMASVIMHKPNFGFFI